MSETETPARDPRIVPASNVGNTFDSYYEALALCSQLQPREAFAVPKLDPATGKLLRLDMMRDIAESMSVGRKAIVVIDHGSVFEVRRLDDGAQAKLFYRLLNLEREPDAIEHDETEGGNKAQDAILWEVIEDVFKLGFEHAKIYDHSYKVEMFNSKIVPYSFIHRKVATKAIFKRSPEGSTAALKKSLFNLMQAGKLVALSKEFGQTTYKTTAQLYRVIEE